MSSSATRTRKRTQHYPSDPAPPMPSPPPMPPAVEPPMPPTPAPVATSVSVLVPWRANPERQRLWNHLRPQWESLGWQIVEGTCEGAWSKGRAVADACDRSDGDVLVITDADVWCDGVVRCVEAVAVGAPWGIPHYRVLRLTKPATADVLASGEWPRRRLSTTYAQRPYPGRPGGGIVVLGRELYRQVPIDPRFRGWGQEDESWALALGTVGGRSWRGTADLWHLWHEPQVRQSRVTGSAASLALHRRYLAARRNPARMRALLSEFAAVSEPVP